MSSTEHEIVSKSTLRQEVALIKYEAKQGLRWLGGLTALMWALEIVDQIILAQRLDALGIRPRTLSSLWAILTAPWLHGGFGHIMANTVPFLVLGGLVWMQGRREWAAATAASALVGGLGIWLLGASNSIHVGASILIFGYFGYLVSAGWFERKISSILLSLFVIVTYGSMIFGVFPHLAGANVSWEGHLFGALGGVLAAWKLHARPKRKALPA